MNKHCELIGCNNFKHAKNLCDMHYRRKIRKGYIGQPGALRHITRNSSLIDKFFKNIAFVSDCWLWQAGKTKAGYAEIQVNKITMYGHVWSYKYFIGEIPYRFTVDHTCHNDSICINGAVCIHRLCVNPDHLEAVTRGENVRRGFAMRRRARLIS